MNRVCLPQQWIGMGCFFASAVLVAGCGNSADGGAASAAPVVSAAPKAETSPPPAAPTPAPAAPAAVKGTCPDPAMTWDDNAPMLALGHCKSTGSVRMIEGVWDKKLADDPTFKLTSKSPLPIGSVHAMVFAYDKSGKLLQWPNEIVHKQGHETSGSGVVGGGLKPKESKPVSIKLPKANLPEGTASLEIEFDSVSWGDPGGWENFGLSGTDRPRGGVK